MKYFWPRHWLIALAVFFAVAGAASARDMPWDEINPQAADVAGWLKQVETVVRIHSDPAQRAIVCRVPFTNLSITALVRATQIPRPQLMSAVTKLRHRGLIEVTKDDHGHQIIVPASETARKFMRKWAYDWCASDDACEVSK